MSETNDHKLSARELIEVLEALNIPHSVKSTVVVKAFEGDVPGGARLTTIEIDAARVSFDQDGSHVGTARTVNQTRAME